MMIQDTLWCDFCGNIVRHYDIIFIHYEFRWWKKWRVCVCEECIDRLPAEEDDDKPKHLMEVYGEDSN